MPRQRILAVASHGGHWIELSRILPAFDGHDVSFVTTGPDDGERVNTFFVADASRWSKGNLFKLALQLFKLQRTFQPDIVITTGAAPGLIALVIGKMLGARTVWIDSLASTETLSLSGRLASRVSDLWLTQWPEIAARHTGLEYHGSVI